MRLSVVLISLALILNTSCAGLEVAGRLHAYGMEQQAHREHPLVPGSNEDRAFRLRGWSYVNYAAAVAAGMTAIYLMSQAEGKETPASGVAFGFTAAFTAFGLTCSVISAHLSESSAP